MNHCRTWRFIIAKHQLQNLAKKSFRLLALTEHSLSTRWALAEHSLSTYHWALTEHLSALVSTTASLRGTESIFALKNLNLTFLAWENANSTVKMNPKTSIRTCLPRHNSGLGHWSKIGPLLRLWFIIFFQYLKFVKKKHFFEKTPCLCHFFKKIPTEFFQIAHISCPTSREASGSGGDAVAFFFVMKSRGTSVEWRIEKKI